jgi:hypothetical protein
MKNSDKIGILPPICIQTNQGISRRSKKNTRTHEQVKEFFIKITKEKLHMPNLYDLAAQYKQFYDFMDNALSSDEDFTEEDLQLYFETLESLEDNLEQKLENTIKFLRNIEGDIEAYKKEKQRFERKQKYLQNTYDRLKQWMRDSLEQNGIEKMKAGQFSVRLQKNNPSVDVYDVEKVPKQYVTKTEIHVDKKQILADLKEGKQIDGVQLAPESKHVRIS